jgi:hypothetical protein
LKKVLRAHAPARCVDLPDRRERVGVLEKQFGRGILDDGAG